MSQREHDHGPVPEWRVRRALDVMEDYPPPPAVSHTARVGSEGRTDIYQDREGGLPYYLAFVDRAEFRERYLDWIRKTCVEDIVRRIGEQVFTGKPYEVKSDRRAIRVAVEGSDAWRSYAYSMLDSASRAVETVTDEVCRAVILREAREEARQKLFKAARSAMELGVPDEEIDRTVNRARVSSVLDDGPAGEDGGP